jgi:hypothetical protein
MQVSQESAAIRRLIEEIDRIEAPRDRTGRRLVILFLTSFAGSVCLLFWTVTHAQPVVRMPGPRVPAVLQSARPGR